MTVPSIASAVTKTSPWGAIASGASGVLGSLINIGQAKKQRKFQKEMASTAYQRDMEMWNKANAYNAPAAQMERLKEAGLNPNLIYGTGASGATGTTSTSMPKYQSTDTPVAQIQMPEVLSMLGQFVDIKGKTLSNDAQAISNQYIENQLIQESQGRSKTLTKHEIDLGQLKGQGGPYLQKQQQQVKSLEINNAIKNIMLQGFKTMPPALRAAMPLIQSIMGKM